MMPIHFLQIFLSIGVLFRSEFKKIKSSNRKVQEIESEKEKIAKAITKRAYTLLE